MNGINRPEYGLSCEAFVDTSKAKITTSARALAIALTVFYLTSFAPGVFHNAASDMRHTMAVPCH